MVNRQSRRQAAYDRATTWGDSDDEEYDNRRNRSSSRASTQRNAYNWSSQSGDERKDATAGNRSDSPKQSYWSPAANQSISRPSANPESKNRQSAIGNRTPQFNRRDSVQHPKFGVGTVIESQLTRDDEEVTIAFPGIGIKKLSVSMAGLKKL